MVKETSSLCTNTQTIYLFLTPFRLTFFVHPVEIAFASEKMPAIPGVYHTPLAGLVDSIDSVMLS